MLLNKRYNVTYEYTDTVGTLNIGPEVGNRQVYFFEDISEIANNCTLLAENLSNIFSLIKPNYIKNMYLAYDNCYNLTGSPVCGDNTTNMGYTYYNCGKLTGSPVCSNNVVDMIGTYYRCSNLTGSPVFGDNVNNIRATYYACQNLTGSPVCGNNVVDMGYTYYACQNLTGSPVCGDNVVNMSSTYSNCYNLTGSPACGNNVTDMSRAYGACGRLTGDMYCYYNKNTYATNISMYGCFAGHNNSYRINIWVKKGYAYDNALYNSPDSPYGQIVASPITWTTMTNGYYNSAWNIYVYNNL